MSQEILNTTCRAVPRLFLADDNPHAGTLLNVGFSDAGRTVEIVQAYDGIQAFNFLHMASLDVPFPYNLIVLDVYMPRMDGLELFRKLYSDPDLAQIPIVILTASVKNRDRFDRLQVKPNAYLNKPDGYNELVAITADLVPYLFPDESTKH
jgi:CheY-like chemotaxis protein